MGDTDPELIKAIVHYQQCLEKYARRDDESKMLYCIGKLHKLPIAIEHLEQTGVGRTVNSLRRLNGNVGEAAKELVNKWKEMVVGKDSPAENSSKPENSRSHKEEKRRYKDSSSSSKHKEKKIKLEEEKSSDDEEEINFRIEKIKNKYNEDIENNHNSRNSSHRSSRKKEDSENEEKERHKHKSEHKSHKSEHKKKRHGSDSDSEGCEVEKSKHKSSKRKIERVDEDDNHYKIKNKHKHKSSKRKVEESDEDDSSENNRQSDSEEEEKIVHKEKYKEKPHSSKEKVKSSNKAKIKHENDNSKHDYENQSTKEKEKSKKHEAKSSKHSNHSSSSQEKEKEKSKKSKPRSSKHKEKEKNKSSGGKSKTTSYDNGIGSESGTSFAEALGMLLPPSSSKLKKKTTQLSSSIQERAVESDDSPKENSKVEVSDTLSKKKLDPLNINMVTLLPEITPNYRPLGNFPLDGSYSKNKISSEEEALEAILNSKIARTKVYSGNKVAWAKVPTLFDLCTHVLQDNIDALEYTGGVPYIILKPVVERANPDQLFTLEHHNPYLIEETDELWRLHCQREFRNKKREEMETWRDMYMRCLDEREAKLKALTANIKQSQDKSLPVRTTKLAYVDGHSIVKPPRNVARQQAKHGTGGDKKPLVTPSSRLAALATAGDAGKISVPNPGAKAASSSSSYGSPAAAAKPKKAPLMQKTLALMKNRMFRR